MNHSVITKLSPFRVQVYDQQRCKSRQTTALTSGHVMGVLFVSSICTICSICVLGLPFFGYVANRVYLKDSMLRILASYRAKTAKISNLWTFWPIIQLISHLFKIGQNLAALFISIKCWAKRLFDGFWIGGLLAELQARTSRSCRFLLFLPHN